MEVGGIRRTGQSEEQNLSCWLGPYDGGLKGWIIIGEQDYSIINTSYCSEFSECKFNSTKFDKILDSRFPIGHFLIPQSGIGLVTPYKLVSCGIILFGLVNLLESPLKLVELRVISIEEDDRHDSKYVGYKEKQN